jgi:hypothetical protein
MFTINLLIPIMATFVANKHFHCAVAVWTLNKVRNFSSNIRNLKVRAKMNRTSNFLMMFSKWKFIAFSDNHIFPFVKLCHCLQNCSSMANRSHNRPFGYNSQQPTLSHSCMKAISQPVVLLCLFSHAFLSQINFLPFSKSC